MPPENLSPDHPAALEVQRRADDLRRALRAVRQEALSAPHPVWLDGAVRQCAADAADTLRTFLAGTAELAADAARVESARRARQGDTW